MIEPERVDAAGRALYEFFVSETPRDHPKYRTWEQLNDATKNDWRLMFFDGYQAYNDARPGRPCSHPEFHNTGRCAEMECSNYIEKHRHPAGYGEIQ